MVIWGDVGIGKTALLNRTLEQAADCRAIRTAGVEAERELAFAALHQVCLPMLSELEILPAPQRDALRTAFGLEGGSPPDRFMVGLAVLGLFAEVAQARPLLLSIDDAQWLDRASAQVLGFAARRLGTESVGMIFAARARGDQRSVPELAGLPEMQVVGLPDHDARALVALAHPGPVDDGVLNRIIAECQGNPLALLELPRGFTPAELAGGSAWSAQPRCRAASKRAFVGRWPRSRRRCGRCCSSPPRNRSAIRCSSGARWTASG